jgi:hypothetical protein
MSFDLSKIKFGKLLSQAVIIGLLVAILVILVQGRGATYVPSPLVTKPGSQASSGPTTLSDIPSSLECTPGPSEKAAYYTRGLTPGGLCGDGDMVRNQIRDFSIENGIGGSLLERT